MYISASFYGADTRLQIDEMPPGGLLVCELVEDTESSSNFLELPIHTFVNTSALTLSKWKNVSNDEYLSNHSYVNAIPISRTQFLRSAMPMPIGLCTGR